MRSLRVLCLALVTWGCSPSGPPPDASVTTILGSGGISMTFDGEHYGAFAAQTAPSDPPDGTMLIIRLTDLAPIGVAVDADPALFPDRTVFRIRNVNPRDAVVMFDRSAKEPEMLAFTRDGKSPTIVPGLCDYYADPTDPSLHQCRPTDSQNP
jgi:hypothetical protein